MVGCHSFRYFLCAGQGEADRQHTRPSRSRRMTSKLKLGTAAIFVAASSLVSAIASAQQVGHLAEHAKMLLSKGEHERIVPLFRYFEESVSPAEVYGDKRAVLTFFVLLRDYFGRLDRVVASSSTSLTYINIYIESATPDLWRK